MVSLRQMVTRLKLLGRRLLNRPLPPAPPSGQPSFAERLAAGYTRPFRPIESTVEPGVLQALFTRTQEQWRRLGETEPHWSVLTHDAFRADRLDAAAEEAFYETGRGNADLIELFEARADVHVGRGVCLELGCGVGRITRHLAAKFERVIAVDISPGNIAIARRQLADAGIGNVELVLLETIEAAAALPPFDVLYSMIAFQHNSPPVQAYLLDILLGKIRPGGGALFQVVSDLPEYAFSAADYLNSPDSVMEIHALPQPQVLARLRANGLTIHEVAMDAWLDAYGSNTFFATKPL